MRSPPRPPSVARCGLLLLAVRAHLKLFGFGRSVAAARRLAGEPSAVPPGVDPREMVTRSGDAVAIAGAFFPGRAICLEQSLALFVLLRRRGVPAELRFGVQPYPFSAHAWVEYGETPVNENPEHIAALLPLPAFPS